MIYITKFEVDGIPYEITPGQGEHIVSILAKVKIPFDIVTRNAVYISDGKYGTTGANLIKIHDKLRLNIGIDKYTVITTIKPDNTVHLKSAYIEILVFATSGLYVNFKREAEIFGYRFNGNKYIKM